MIFATGDASLSHEDYQAMQSLIAESIETDRKVYAAWTEGLEGALLDALSSSHDDPSGEGEADYASSEGFIEAWGWDASGNDWRVELEK